MLFLVSPKYQNTMSNMLFIYPTVSIENCVNISEQNISWQAVNDMLCTMSVMAYFDWLKEQPVNEVPSTEQTLMYSKTVMLCVCHSFFKPVKNLVLCCTIMLYICTHYLDVTKGSWIIYG